MLDKPTKSKHGTQETDDVTRAPGDEAAPGTPGTGEERREVRNLSREGRIIKAISAGP